MTSSYHLEDKNKNVPKLRFKWYNDEWKYYRLKDITTRITRKNKNLESNRPLTISAIDGLIDQKDYFNKQIASKDMSGYYLLKNGEFAYNKSYSKGFPYGSIKRLNKYDKGALSTLYICFSLQNICSDFFEKYFETDKWYKEIYMIAVEGARNHGLLNISVEDFFNTMHKFPNIEEQEKIASFLTLIDKKIEKQKELVKLLKKYKRGLLTKIFRLKNNNWECEKLGELCNITTGKLDANAMKPNGQYRFYTCAKEFYFIDEFAFDTDALLVSGNGANVGYIHHYNGKFNAYQRTYVLDKFKQNIIFVKYYLETFLHQRIESEKKAGNTPYIVLSTLSDLLIRFPTLDEQNKITAILSEFDLIIQKQESLLEQNLLFKKGLLQQMFI